MESLTLGVYLKNSNYLISESIFELPHLKSLLIECSDVTTGINSILRTLCDAENIEELSFSNGIFNKEILAPPLIFKKLQTFDVTRQKNIIGLLNLLTRSEMPAISRLSVDSKDGFSKELLKFIASKNTLKWIQLPRLGHFVQIEVLLQLIDILKKPCTPKRQILILLTTPFELNVR